MGWREWARCFGVKRVWMWDLRIDGDWCGVRIAGGGDKSGIQMSGVIFL